MMEMVARSKRMRLWDLRMLEERLAEESEALRVLVANLNLSLALVLT